MSAQVKDINIKNCTYYFFSDMINIEDFDSNFLKVDIISYKNINMYCICYVTINKVDRYENSVNPLYLIVNKASRHIKFFDTEEKNGNKYLVFDSVDYELVNKYTKLWERIKHKIKYSKELIVEKKEITEKIL